MMNERNTVQRIQACESVIPGQVLLSQYVEERTAAKDARIEQLEDALHRLDQWSQAYPLDVFPEPDFKRAAEVLKSNGMTIDAISASNMRHVITRVREIIADVLTPNPKLSGGEAVRAE